MSDDNDSEEEFIPKRRSVKNTIASDDENGDSVPIYTEDITLRLSDDEDNEDSSPSVLPVEERHQIISAGISEDLGKEKHKNGILPQSSDHTNPSRSQVKISNQVPFDPLIDSDSEQEESLRPNVESALSKTDADVDSHDTESPRRNQTKSKPTKQKRPSIWDSDSDKDEKVDTSTKPSEKRSSLFDSDSDNTDQPKENFNNVHEDPHDAESPRSKPTKSKSTRQKRRSIWDSDSDEDVDTSTTPSQKRSSLFDSDSDDADQLKENFAHGESAKKDSGKSKKSSAGKQKKGSSKDAMLTIRSESQRMTRESAISLPYHRPKQHSLSDFLNRPRLAPTSIKASVEELVRFQKESEKEIKEFYQSESEHSDDDKDNDPDWNEGQDKDENEENEKGVAAGEEVEPEDEKKNANEDGDVDTLNDEDKDTEMKDEGFKETNAKNGAVIETDGETLKKSDEETEEKKKNDDVMETEEIVLDEKLEDQNEIGRVDDVVNEENAEEKRDVVNVASQEGKPNEENNSSASTLHQPQVDAETLDEEDTPEEVADKTDESKKTESCPIDSQDVRLKYSEDLSEAFGKRTMNFDPISDSDDDDDVQMVKDPPKPKEEAKLILKGNPNDVIDLDDDFTTHKSKTEDLEGLKNRFMRHSLSSKPRASPKTLSIKVVDLAPDGSIKGINEETVAWSSEKDAVDHRPPGLKMKLLKRELERQIIEQREKEFEEKESSGVRAAKDDYEDGDDDILDDKEDDDGVSTVGGDDEASEDDAEDEVDDVEDEIDEEEEISERPRKKNAFVDDEASVDDDVEENSVDLDDDEHVKEDEEDENSIDTEKPQFSRTDTNVDMFASQMSDEDEMIPGYQPCGGHRNASSLSLPRSTAPCSETNANESLRLPDSPNSSFQRMLRLSSDFNSQNTGFSATQILKRGTESEEKKDGIMQLAQSPEVLETEADLMAMCSGQFTTQPFPLESQGDNLARTDNSTMTDSQDSQDLQLKWTEDSPTDESKSPTKVGKTRLIIDSSDEDGDDETETIAKRKTKRLSFSDEESNSVDVDDFINDEEEEENDLPDPADVMYDSDENEIPIKDAAAFLENEAELSEDEYVGSGDEDEGGDNDQMEEELGDMDEFDQDKVREELGRIHMRNMLDDDRRDVRLMQEMLLEDGELHEDGKGRQRQFRWKNADLATLISSETAGSDDEKVDEDEDDDGEWRQNRHEREMFLAGVLKDKDGKSVEIQVEEEQEDSELMVLGKTVLKRQSSTRIEIKETATKPAQPSVIPDSPMKSLLSRTHSRGSFLSRTSDVLTRLAQNAAEKNGIVETKVKNSRNFVFAAISPPKPQENGDDIENEPRSNAKRKAKRSLIAQPEKKSCTSQSTGYTSLFNYL